MRASASTEAVGVLPRHSPSSHAVVKPGTACESTEHSAVESEQRRIFGAFSLHSVAPSEAQLRCLAAASLASRRI